MEYYDNLDFQHNLNFSIITIITLFIIKIKYNIR